MTVARLAFERKGFAVQLLRVAGLLAWALFACSPTGVAGAQTLQVDRGRVGLAPGTSATIAVAGASGAVGLQPSFDGIVAAYDPPTRHLLITARAPGSGTLVLTDATGATATIAVLVAPLAGVLPTDVSIDLAGTVTPAYARAKIVEAIAQATQRAPQTALDIHGIDIANDLAPGDVLEAQAGVHIDGAGALVDVSGRTSVHLRVLALPALQPQVLWYSDDPEYVGAGLDGVLVRGTLAPETPVRIFAYHVAAGAPRRVALVLTARGAAERVQVLGTIVGPSPDYGYVGQQSSARFLHERATQQSSIVTVPGGGSLEIPFGTLQPNDLIEAVLDLRVLDGGPLDAALVTASDALDLTTLAASPELAGDGHGRRGVFALDAVAPIALNFTAGAAEPDAYIAGLPSLANLRPGGTALAGDYGVVRPVALHLTNPTGAPQNVSLYAMNGSGSATVTLWFDGDAAATLVPCVNDGARHLVRTFALAAGETRAVTGAFMTDGASAYPVQLGLTADTPAAAAPGGCAPATP